MSLLLKNSNKRLMLYLQKIIKPLESILNKSISTPFNSVLIHVFECLTNVFILFEKSVPTDFITKLYEFMLKYFPDYFNCIIFIILFSQ